MRFNLLILIIFLLSSICFPVRLLAQEINIFISPHGSDEANGSFHSPVKSLHAAQNLARKARQQRPSLTIQVMLRNGTYYLDSSLVFTWKDNLNSDIPVTYQNYSGEKVAISGGRRLHLKWTLWKNGIWHAQVPGDFNFDQLFVNGIKQVRARYPNYDSSAVVFNGVSKDALDPERIKKWQNPSGGFIHALQRAHWGSLHYQIAGKNKESNLILKGGNQINRSHIIDSSDVFVENIFEELDTANEWFFDNSKRTLYYIAPKDLDLKRAKIEVAILTQLLIFKGDSLSPVTNIHFKGITFTHAKETFMLTTEPLLRGDWNIFRGGAIFLNGTEHCGFSNCHFESVGGNAVFFSNYNRYDTIEHCLIKDAGASGICFVGDISAVRSPSFSYSKSVSYQDLDTIAGPKNNNFSQHCYIYDNLINNIGQIEKQTAGIHLSMCMDIYVSHNTIYHVPRAGININDGTWGGHVIVDNDVFETVLETGDHGAFNSWGRDRYWSADRQYMDSLTFIHPELVKLDVIHPVVIRHNRLRCDRGWDIDLDDGSTNYVIDSNLCLNGGIKLREGFFRSVKNNLMINNTFHPHVWFRNSLDVFMRNIVMKPYAPIQVSYWGDTIDYNLFPDSAVLAKAQANGIDRHSAVEFPSFSDPSKGDYHVTIDSIVPSIRYVNFSMNDFGVISPGLKSIARHPEFPLPVKPAANSNKDNLLYKWHGATIKKVEGENEQSALGLPNVEGIYITQLLKNSPAWKNGLRENDVILKVEKTKISSFTDFEKALQHYENRSSVSITIYRNQQIKILILKS